MSLRTKTNFSNEPPSCLVRSRCAASSRITALALACCLSYCLPLGAQEAGAPAPTLPSGPPAVGIPLGDIHSSAPVGDVTVNASNSSAEDLLVGAIQALRRNEYDRAEGLARQFLARFPNDARVAQANATLGKTLQTVGRYSEAIDPLERAAAGEADPSVAAALSAMACDAALQAKDWQRADSLAEKFLEDYPNDARVPTVLELRGDVAYQQQRYADAISLYERVLNEHGTSQYADQTRLKLADTLRMDSRFDEAENYYQALMAKTGLDLAPRAHQALGEMQWSSGRHSEAMRTLSDFVAAYPEHDGVDEARLILGWLLYQDGQLPEAENFFEPLTNSPGMESQANYWLAIVKRDRGDFEGVVAVCRRAIPQMEPSELRSRLQIQLANALTEQEEYPAAEAELLALEQSLGADDPLRERVLFQRIRLADGLGNAETLDAQVAQFENAYPESPLLPFVRRMRAKSLMARRNYELAHGLFSELTSGMAGTQDLSPAEWDAYCEDLYFQTVCLWKLGDPQNALQPFDWLAKQGAASLRASALLERASLLITLKRPDDAITELTAALQAQRGMDGRFVLKPLLVGDPQPEVAPGEPLPIAWSATELERAVLLLVEAHLAKKDVSAAKSLFDAYRTRLGTAPRSEFLNATAAAARLAGENAWADELQREAEAAGPETVQTASLTAALALYERREWSAAADALLQLLDQNPPEALAARATMLRGAALEEIGRGEEALVMYDRITSKYPNAEQWPDATYSAARYLDRQGKSALAADRYQKLLEASPGYEHADAAMYYLAWNLTETGRKTEAAEWFERVRRDFPDSKYRSHATLPLAHWAYERGEYNEANRLISQAVVQKPDRAVYDRLLYLEARVAMAQHDWSGARRSLDRLQRECPNSELVQASQFGMAESAFHAREFETAQQEFAALAEQRYSLDPDMAATVLLRLAQIKLQSVSDASDRRIVEAEQLAKDAQRMAPNFQHQYEIDYILGRCEAAKGRFDDARAYYGRVLSATTATAAAKAKAKLMTAETYRHQNDLATALQWYESADMAQVDESLRLNARLQAGHCLNALGRKNEAVAMYAEVVKEAPLTEEGRKARALWNELQPQLRGN